MQGKFAVYLPQVKSVGMISETNGTVLYKNQDITMNRKALTEDVGYCPQQNVYFPYLTVAQHLLFFTMVNMYL